MMKQVPSIAVLIIILITFLRLTEIHGKPPFYILNFCLPAESGPYTANSYYQKNLNSVLSDLSSQSSSLSFYSTSTGTAPNDVYALFFCRYDLPSTDCHACVEAAIPKLTSNCTHEKEAIAYYEQCTLRYANRNIFSFEEEIPGFWRFSSINVTMNLTEFNSAFSNSLDRLIKEVVSATYNTSSLKYFKTQVSNISSEHTLYLLVQCTPDITPSSCERCLRTTDRDMPKSGSTWIFLFRPSCQVVYDLSPFFELPPSPPPLSAPSSSSRKGVMYYVIRAVIPGAVGLLLLLGILIYLIRWRKETSTWLRKPRAPVDPNKGGNYEVQTRDQCVQFNFKTLEAATNKFSQSDQLGRGGFGIVYRGVLQDGQVVAVKRLSKVGGQGAKEFKTEVEVVANLQHKNLVRLVGYCIEEEERLVVYEFLPNLSLDNILFSSVRGASLTWAVRYKIIAGIARGLHYLHEDSRIKIVHRDLKTSNILLDDNMDPKIADFGMARLMQVDQTQASTSRIVGTFGYIAPEYALAGRCTPKSDIYSFGVIILEILSGKRCSQFYQSTHGEGISSYAYRVWTEDAIEELVDQVLQNNYSRNEAKKCIQIGLLCVQDDEANRPTTQTLLFMLSNNSIDLPSPLPPSLFSNRVGMSSEGADMEGEKRSLHQETNYSGKIDDSWYDEKELYAR